MKKRHQTLFIIFFCITLSNFSQNEQSKWAIDVGSASVYFEKGATPQVGYRYLEAAARLGLTKYIYKDLSISGSISNSIISKKEYLTLDGELRYGFGTSNKKIFNLISIYASIGTSYLFKPNLVTLNFGGGGTLWLSKKFGLTSSLIYKLYGVPNFPGSHFYGSGGFVYQFSKGNNSGSKPRKAKGGSRSRIWNY